MLFGDRTVIGHLLHMQKVLDSIPGISREGWEIPWITADNKGDNIGDISADQKPDSEYSWTGAEGLFRNWKGF